MNRLNRADAKRLEALEAAAQQSTLDAGARVVLISDGCLECRGACKGHQVPAVTRGAAVVLRIVDRAVLQPSKGPSPAVMAGLKSMLSIEALLEIGRREREKGEDVMNEMAT